MTEVILLSHENIHSGRELEHARHVVSLMSEFVNDPVSLKRIRSETYGTTYRSGESNIAEKTVATAEQLEYDVTYGRELGTAPDARIELQVVVKNLEAGNLAVVRWLQKVIETDYEFFSGCVERGDAVSLASLWLHEWVHVAGYWHVSGGDITDMPYKMESLVKAWATAVHPEAPGQHLSGKQSRSNLPLHALRSSNHWSCEGVWPNTDPGT